MENYEITATDFSPRVSLDAEEGVFVFEGNSTMKDSKSFYLPVIKWIENYCLQAPKTTHVEFKFSDVNQKTLKALLYVCRAIKTLELEGKKINISWHLHPEADMHEIGQDVAYMSDMNFRFPKMQLA